MSKKKKFIKMENGGKLIIKNLSPDEELHGHTLFPSGAYEDPHQSVFEKHVGDNYIASLNSIDRENFLEMIFGKFENPTLSIEDVFYEALKRKKKTFRNKKDFLGFIKNQIESYRVDGFETENNFKPTVINYYIKGESEPFMRFVENEKHLKNDEYRNVYLIENIIGQFEFI